MLEQFLPKLFPKEEKFFDLFNSSAKELTTGTSTFIKLVNDLKNSKEYIDAIEEAEHRADNITHKTVECLHKTFITPLDRDDIHQLITKMDDILDFINAAAQRIRLFEITTATPEMKALAEICHRSTELVQNAVRGLENLKHPSALLQICVEINRLENEADSALRVGVAKLFREETDVKAFIKYKEIYELLETVTDCCEDVANIIEGIVLEYA